MPLQYGYWFWCEPARAYYPYITWCPVPWRIINPATTEKPYPAPVTPPNVPHSAPATPDTLPSVSTQSNPLDEWCAKIKLPSSIAICSDTELRSLMIERQKACDGAKARLTLEQQKALLADQNRWVRSYSTACGLAPDAPPTLPLAPAVKDCMIEAGRSRIAYLNTYAVEPGSGGASAPSSPMATSSPTSAQPPPVTSTSPDGGSSQEAPQSQDGSSIGFLIVGIIVIGIGIKIWRACERAKMRRREIALTCEYFNLVNASRRFPAVGVSVILEPTEFGLLVTPATLCEMRAHRATAGGRVRIAKSVRVGVRKYEYSYRQLDPVASGTLIVTNHRVVFKSDERPVHLALSELVDVEYDGCLRLSIRRRQTPIILRIAPGNLAMLLIRLFAKDTFPSGELPEGLIISARPDQRGRGVVLNFDMPGPGVATATMCPPNTDVTVSAIYKCHRHRGLGRAAGGREAPGVAQRPIDARHGDGRNCTRLFDRAGSARPARRTAQPTLNRRASR